MNLFVFLFVLQLFFGLNGQTFPDIVDFDHINHQTFILIQSYIAIFTIRCFDICHNHEVFMIT